MSLEGAICLKFGATRALGCSLARTLIIIKIVFDKRASYLVHDGVLIIQRLTSLSGTFGFTCSCVAKDGPFTLKR